MAYTRRYQPKTRAAVECSESRRKATVEWVEQMAMKHESLPTSKLVLVSASGFSKAAVAKAKALGIEAYSLEWALESDWASFLGRDQLEVWALRVRGCELVLATGSDVAHPAPPETAVFRPDGSYRGTLREIIGLLEGSGELSEGAIEHARKSGESESWAECGSEPPLVVKDANMVAHVVTTIRVRVEVVRAPGTVELKRARFRGNAVAYGRGQSPAGELTLSLVQRPDAALTGALSVADPETAQVRTVDVTFTPERRTLRFVAGPVREASNHAVEQTAGSPSLDAPADRAR
jgi:hypothetical protein